VAHIVFSRDGRRLQVPQLRVQTSPHQEGYVVSAQRLKPNVLPYQGYRLQIHVVIIMPTPEIAECQKL
jgi:hypothetical protein